jgi:hypothetical protein
MKRELVSEESMINDILENFDWEKCVKTMKALNWTWALVGFPQVHNLKETAKHLLNSSIQGVKEKDINFHSSYFSVTGGLKATAWKNRFGQVVGINLEFVVTDWESDGDYHE